MTVEELIEILEKFPQDSLLAVSLDDLHCDVAEVIEVEHDRVNIYVA